MSGLKKAFGAAAVLICAVQMAGAYAQEGKRAESEPPSGVRHARAESSGTVDKECIGAEGASVCWLQFTDGTRCVVASNSGGGDSAINCHFSTPLERLHRMPKD